MMNQAAEALLDDLRRFLPEGMTMNGWAVAAGVNRTVWGDIRRHGNPSRRTMEKLLAAAGSSLAEFEALRVGVPPSLPMDGAGGVAEHGPRGWRGATPGPLRLHATEEAGAFDGLATMVVGAAVGDVTLPRPAKVADDCAAYAVTMAGNSMWPRFRPGRRLVVSPTPNFVAGDDVLVRVAGRSGQAVIAELVAQERDGWTLRQFTPDRTVKVPAVQVETVEKVLGEVI
jgi:hypothetical protein